MSLNFQESFKRLLPAAGLIICRLLFVSVLLLLWLPVCILPISTAVPLPLWVLLSLLNGFLLVLVIWRKWAPRLMLAALGGALVVLLAAVLASQLMANTPSISDAQGQPVPGSIASLEKVNINGSEQWISIRGKNINNPVLLYLGAGGPGAGGFATRSLFEPLEEHFVIVAWDEPGTGKSYHARPIESLDRRQFVEDARALTELLRARFHQDKIYVYGVSWTSILGIWLVQDYPDLYAAYIGNGQMVNTTENDILGYNLAVDYLTEKGDGGKLNQLKQNGPPPYAGAGLGMKYLTYLDVLNEIMGSPSYGLLIPLMPMFSPEYGLLDKVDHFLGLYQSFEAVYPQLRDLDFVSQAPRLKVPVYFLLGRQDVNAMSSLAEEYFQVLQAPRKELIWFSSGHGLSRDNMNQFVDVMVNKVLKDNPVRTQQTGVFKLASPAAVANGLDPLQVKLFLDDFMPRQLEEEHQAGAAVVVVQNGEVLYSGGYGFADLERQTAVDADRTIFLTGSSGKLFTWTAVMQLVEQGKLDLDADVNNYLDFAIPATYAEPITLRHLMAHTAGFEDKPFIFARRVEDISSLGEYLAANIPLRVRPAGKLSAYSNYGAALAGYIVERVSGMPFEDYIEANIFKPLDMPHSTFRQQLSPEINKNLALPYTCDEQTCRPAARLFVRAAPAGSSSTTVNDMAHFMIAHLQNGQYNGQKIMEEQTARLMHSRLFAHDERVNGMAYGFAEVTLNEQRIIKHNGMVPASYNSLLALLPENGLGIYAVYNSNGQAAPGEHLLLAFMERFYPVETNPVISAAGNDDLAGNYRSTRMFESSFARAFSLFAPDYADISIQRQADGSYHSQGGLPALNWVPIAVDTLRRENGDRNSPGDLVFARDTDGQVQYLFINNNPYRAYIKTAWYESQSFALLLAAGCELVFLSGLVLSGLKSRRKWVFGLLAAACVLMLIFPLLMGISIVVETSYLYGVTPMLVISLATPLTGLGLALASVVLFFKRDGRRMGLAGRIHYGLILAVMLVFAGWLNAWNLLGFRF
ncbi:MAG: alpha/beta fold hydrolase [Anaerolineae bacterium]|nr:alpha/beta fold hydrolase [Anaerolineae bacterium]